MHTKRIGRQTVRLSSPPSVAGFGSAAGRKEGLGPLGRCFDFIADDDTLNRKTWEQAEMGFQKKALAFALDRAGIRAEALDYLFAGDLLNQCVASSFTARETGIPFFGLYAACSTMAEGLSLAGMLLDGGFCHAAAALTSSHFCSAERQYRNPLEYGGQKPPTAQWTATGAGAVILTPKGSGPWLTHITTGRVVDKGIRDANNMGAAMAPAAYAAMKAHFSDTGRSPSFYDCIVTGDLGQVGKDIVLDLFMQDGMDLSQNYRDCGVLLFDAETQDVHAGGSGCGCSALILSGYLLPKLREGTIRHLLFCGTGSLHSPLTSMQGESIPGICHAVAFSMEKGGNP